MFKLVDFALRKLPITGNILIFAKFKINKRFIVAFEAAENKNNDRIAIYEIDPANGHLYYSDHNYLDKIYNYHEVNLRGFKYLFTFSLLDNRIQIKSNIFGKGEKFIEYTFNDFEMGIFEAARKRAHEKLIKLKEEANV
jgi:hypothetical protein